MDRFIDKSLPLWLERRIKYGYADDKEVERWLSTEAKSSGTEVYACPKGCQTGCSKVIKCPKTPH
jgi:hypothetical protein